MEKEEYLDLFEKAEKMIDETYEDFVLPLEYIEKIKSIDYDNIINKRISNSRFLEEELSEYCWIKMPKIKYGDVPLFYPVFINDKIRDSLKVNLVNKNLFCPVHWPYSKDHKHSSDLYKTELSIICDQRYDIFNLNKIISVIKENGEKIV